MSIKQRIIHKKNVDIFTKVIFILIFISLSTAVIVFITEGFLRYQNYQKTLNSKSKSKSAIVIKTPLAKTTPSPLSIITPIPVYDAGGEYLNKEAFFSLKYPQRTKIYEVSLSGKIDKQAGYSYGYPSALWLMGQFPERQKYGQVGVCAGEVDFANDGCNNGGVMILYGAPEINGKGGYCNSSYLEIRIDGQDAYMCHQINSYLITYPKHPQGLSELNILAWYNNEFTKEDALNIVNSIRFVRQ